MLLLGFGSFEAADGYEGWYVTLSALGMPSGPTSYSTRCSGLADKRVQHHINHLPNAVLAAIFRHLPYEERQSALPCVCSAWRDIVCSANLMGEAGFIAQPEDAVAVSLVPSPSSATYQAGGQGNSSAGDRWQQLLQEERMDPGPRDWQQLSGGLLLHGWEAARAGCGEAAAAGGGLPRGGAYVAMSPRFARFVATLPPQVRTLRLLHAELLGPSLAALGYASSGLRRLCLSGLRWDPDHPRGSSAAAAVAAGAAAPYQHQAQGEYSPHVEAGGGLSQALRPLSTLTSLREVSLQVYSVHRGECSSFPDFLQGALPRLRALEFDASECRGGAACGLPEWLAEATGLRVLQCTDVKLASFPSWLGRLTRLTSLSLRGHGLITSSMDLPEGLEGLQRLKHLDLSGGLITQVPDAVCSLGSLTLLDLSADYDIAHLLQVNGIALASLVLPRGVLTGMTSLRCLALNNYTRVSPPSLELLARLAPRLERLELRHCGLTRMPAPLATAALRGSAEVGCNVGTLALCPVGLALSLAQTVLGWVTTRLLPRPRGFGRRSPGYVWSPSRQGMLPGAPCFRRSWLRLVFDTSSVAVAWWASVWLAAYSTMVSAPTMMLAHHAVAAAGGGAHSLQVATAAAPLLVPKVAAEQFMRRVRSSALRLSWFWAVQTGLLVGPGALLSLPLVLHMCTQGSSGS